MKIAAEKEVYGTANMTAAKIVEIQVGLSDAQTETTTWSIAVTDWVANQLQRVIHGVTSDEQIWFNKKLFTSWIECKAGWMAIGIQELRKTILQRVIHCGNPTMHLVTHTSDIVWWTGSGDDFTTNISEWLHIGNVKEAYRSTNNVNSIWQMLKHNDRCSGLDYMEEALSHLALQGCYNIDSAKLFNLLSATNTRRDSCWAHLLQLQHCQEEPIFRHVSQQVLHLRETHVRECAEVS